MIVVTTAMNFQKTVQHVKQKRTLSAKIIAVFLNNGHAISLMIAEMVISCYNFKETNL